MGSLLGLCFFMIRKKTNGTITIHHPRNHHSLIIKPFLRMVEFIHWIGGISNRNGRITSNKWLGGVKYVLSPSLFGFMTLIAAHFGMRGTARVATTQCLLNLAARRQALGGDICISRAASTRITSSGTCKGPCWGAPCRVGCGRPPVVGPCWTMGKWCFITWDALMDKLFSDT